LRGEIRKIGNVPHYAVASAYNAQRACKRVGVDKIIQMSEVFFWLCFLLGGYSYFVYPLLLALLYALRPRPPAQLPAATPLSLTVIVTAYNEQERIRAKIDNTLALDFPGLEMIVASDCSSDATDSIVREYAARGVQLVRAPERLGKENAQLHAIRAARGDVLVFSDVATQIPADALRKLSDYFRDPAVGAVSSEDRFITAAGQVAGEGAYVRYEMWLRRMESGLAGLVGLSGSFFAARKSVCAQWDIHSPSDFNTALNCARLRLRAVTAPDVLGYYKDLADPQKEYQRKVRTVLRGMTAVVRHADVLNIFRFGLFGWQVWSHKVMRWLVPWFLVLLLISNFLLLGTRPLYTMMLVAQLAFYFIAWLGHVNAGAKRNGIVRIIYFFVQVNVAVADALRRLLTGKRMTTWQPSAR
jgi:cellulose synthase/poly-beta-1,6-N-acetylglucosamine synthase-like glycosyltransferase